MAQPAYEHEQDSNESPREAMRRLVDELPEEELQPARRFLEYLRNMGDPVYRAYLEAPLDDEPLTPEEELAIREGRAAYEAGETRPWEEVREELLRGLEAETELG